MDRWKPVRRGAVYCSPGCGLGCKHADYLKASRKAAAVAHRLGVGWVPEVWENLGWHYRAVKGCMQVRVDDDGTATAFFNGPTQFVVAADHPAVAADLAAQKAKDHCKAIYADLRALGYAK